MIDFKYPPKIKKELDNINHVSKDDAKLALSMLRNFCEEFVDNLNYRFDLKVSKYHKQIAKLEKNECLPRYIINYINHWYNIGCLGAHNNSLTDGDSWENHYKSCLDATNYALKWYVNQNPSIFDIDILEEYSNKSISNLNSLPLEFFVKPTNYEILEDHLEKNNLLFITGEPWLGKTLSAKSLAIKYMKDGYIPIIFKQEIWQNKYDILPQFKLESSSTYLGNLRKDIEKLIQLIKEQSIYGYNFIIIFDDLFGNRTNILKNNNFHKSIINIFPFTDVLKFSNNDSYFKGKIKFLLISPNILYEESKEYIENSDQIIKSGLINILLLSNNYYKLESKNYRKLYQNLVKNLSKYHDSKWKKNEDLIGLISSEFQSKLNSDDNLFSLRKFIIDNKNINNEDLIINSLIKYFNVNSSDKYSLDNADGKIKNFLICTYIYRQIETLFNMLKGKIDISFINIVNKINNSDKSLAEYLDETENWVEMSEERNEDYPHFIHPDINSLIENYISFHSNQLNEDGILIISDGSERFNKIINILSENIDLWIMFHLLVNNYKFLINIPVDTIGNRKIHKNKLKNINLLNDYLHRSVFSGYDIRNVIWATTISFSKLKGIENNIIKNLIHRYGGKDGMKSYRQIYYKEFIDNWIDLDENHRSLFLKSAQIEENNYSMNIFNNPYFSTLYLSIVKNYEIIKNLCNTSYASEILLDAFGAFTTRLKQNNNKSKIMTSLQDDLYNENIPNGVNSDDFLFKVIEVAELRGYINEKSVLLTLKPLKN